MNKSPGTRVTEEAAEVTDFNFDLWKICQIQLCLVELQTPLTEKDCGFRWLQIFSLQSNTDNTSLLGEEEREEFLTLLNVHLKLPFSFYLIFFLLKGNFVVAGLGALAMMHFK